MKRIITFLFFAITLTNCAQEKTQFDKVALDEVFKNVKGQEIQFKDILKKHQGKTIFIDIWASWCSDCVGGIPKLKKLQKSKTDVVYVLLSLDKDTKSWKDGIKKHQLKADHYLFTNKWKQSPFCKSIKLDWIPRYMIVGKDGSVKMYKAIDFKDNKILKTIKADDDGVEVDGF